MAWIYLFIAAICEVGWPVGMKLAAMHPAWRIVWILFAAISMTLSGVFLYLAQRHIPIGTDTPQQPCGSKDIALGTSSGSIRYKPRQQ